jgi:peptidoglycan/LPS O-acetylase OafA/YrhL
LLPRLPVRAAWRWPAVGIGAVVFVLMLADAWLSPDLERALAFGVPAVVIVAMAVIAERAGLRAEQGWIQLLGAASYAIYLTHFFCTQAVVILFEDLHPRPALALAGFPMAFALVALVSILAHRRLELPLTELARRALASNHAPPRPASPDRPEASETLQVASDRSG